MKRNILYAVAVVLALTTAWYAAGAWRASRVPSSIEVAAEHLQRDPLAYAVVDGTPLIVAAYGGAVFLDTLTLDELPMEFPPYPRWQWTGDWERIDNPAVSASADLTAHFGPLVLFGVVNDDRIVSMEVARDGKIVQTIPITGPAYIVGVTDVRLTDDVHFMTSDGIRVRTVDLNG